MGLVQVPGVGDKAGGGEGVSEAFALGKFGWPEGRRDSLGHGGKREGLSQPVILEMLRPWKAL